MRQTVDMTSQGDMFWKYPARTSGLHGSDIMCASHAHAQAEPFIHGGEQVALGAVDALFWWCRDTASRGRGHERGSDRVREWHDRARAGQRAVGYST